MFRCKCIINGICLINYKFIDGAFVPAITVCNQKLDNILWLPKVIITNSSAFSSAFSSGFGA